MKITKWWELTEWNRIRVNKTWFLVLLRRKLFFRDKESLKSMNKNSSEDLLPHNKTELIIYKQWKKLLKDKEMPYSRSLLKRKLREDMLLNLLRQWETTFTLKNKRRKLDDKKLLITTKKFNKKKSSKLLKIINSNLRPKDLPKKREWKTNSRLKWLRNSLRMNVWNRWTPRREEWENYNTRETSKNYGNKNSRCIEPKENKNGTREHKKITRKTTRDKLSQPKKRSF